MIQVSGITSVTARLLDRGRAYYTNMITIGMVPAEKPAGVNILS